MASISFGKAIHYSDQFGDVSELQITQSRDALDVTTISDSSSRFIGGIVHTTVRMRVTNVAAFDIGRDVTFDEVFVPSARGPGIAIRARRAFVSTLEMDTDTATAVVELQGDITVEHVADVVSERLRQKARAIRKEQGLTV